MSTKPVPPKPWSSAVFKAHRPELCRFVDDEVVPAMAAKRLVVVTAPVKSGKREIVEYIAVSTTQFEHAFVSAFHRLDDAAQRGEIARHRVLVFSGTFPSELSRFVQWVAGIEAKKLRVVVHVDECDYGSEWGGWLSTVWHAAHNSGAVEHIVVYSATPQEATMSPCFDAAAAARAGEPWRDVGASLVYRPPAGYCGAAAFLDAGLVAEAAPFVDRGADGRYTASAQALEILAGCRAALAARAPHAPPRNVIFLRLSYSLARLGKAGKPGAADRAVYCVAAALRDLREFDGVAVYLDKGESGGVPAAHRAALSAEAAAAAPAAQCRVTVARLDLGSPVFGATLPADRVVIVIVDMTSMRSTEWSFHDRLYAVHEYRPEVVASAAHQSVMRVAHYATRYPGGFQPIRLYCSVAVVKFAAGRIDVRELTIARVSVSDRVSVTATMRRSVGTRFYPFSAAVAARRGASAERVVELAQEYRRAIECITADAADPTAGLPPPVRAHKFVTVRGFTFDTTTGHIQGTYHTSKVFQYAEFAGASCVDARDVRVCVCYRDGTPGVALIYPSGAAVAGDVVTEVVGSMYGHTLPAPVAK